MKQPAEQPLADMSDAQLAQAYQAGREEAFVALIERYKIELFHFLIRFVGNRAAAEDIFQEAFLQIHLSIDSFDGQRPFKPWLFTIAANKARDHLRRVQRKGGQTTTTLDDGSGQGRSVLDLMDSQVDLPDARATSEETRERVREIVADLPSHLREILLLAYFQQIPYKDIARELGIPLGTVKSRLHSAVGSFAQLWKDRFGNTQEENP